ncbi:hypothetical protein N0V83_001201 [Neocucurbitaria cava]|uniref:Uncharacterized protein n=1 Tax=Neocucurbitaria cava TaxID=798079 RepID=A0A9W9CR03_9PLEO|nr:hypothetical protein N0V83_001201 [Neocucurbitaria cava]
MKNGDYYCKRRNFLSCPEEENIVGLSVGPVAVPTAPVDASDSLDDPLCDEGRLFCVVTNYVDKIYYCEFDRKGYTLIKACGANEYCVGRPEAPEMDPHCAKQTTTTHPTTSASPTSTAPFPYLPEQPTSRAATSSELAPRAEAAPPMCSGFEVFCASSPTGDLMAYCEPGFGPKVLHKCAAGEYCVGVADESKHTADLHCAKDAPTIPPSPSPHPPRYLHRAELSVDDDARVYCDGRYIMHAEAGGGPVEILHMCEVDNYCIGNDNPWEGRIQLSCRYEDPAVSTPGHSHPAPTPTPTGPVRVIGPQPSPAARAASEPIPSEIAAIIQNISNATVDTGETSAYMCGFCINLGSWRRQLSGLGVCNTLANDEEYRACSNQYCGTCIIFRQKNCQWLPGGAVHWGGPGEGSYDARGGHSHYCI